MSPSVSVDTHLPPGWADGAMRDDITRAFTMTPKVLPPMWLYDDRGSELFDRITRLPEYYPTEAERSILAARSGEIARRTGATTVVELGSGTSDKTRTLLDAFRATGQLRRFVPFDVSEATLIEAADRLAKRYDGLEIKAVVGDFTRHLPHLPAGPDRLVAFLGGTIGNFYAEERRAFLGAVADSLESGEWLLLGIDLMKPVGRILDAYNDRAKVTDAFIKNVLAVVNAAFDADFDLECFDYVPFWDGREERVDMRLRTDEPQTTRLRALDLEVEFAAGEEIRVEISTKFRPERLAAELADVGLGVDQLWTDDRADFGLLLARKF